MSVVDHLGSAVLGDEGRAKVGFEILGVSGLPFLSRWCHCKTDCSMKILQIVRLLHKSRVDSVSRKAKTGGGME